jgi:hypothetical protein
MQIQGLHLIKRYKSLWGSIGIMHATLEGIQESMKNKCDYIILLSGSDYPIKSNISIKNFLVKSNGKSYLSHYLMPAPHWEPGKEINRIKKFYFWIGNKLFEYPIHLETQSLSRKIINLILTPFLRKERIFPKGIEPYGGDQWFCLSKEACKIVLNFDKKHPEIISFLKHALISDEIFIQTAILNSPQLKIDEVVNNTITLLNWKNRNLPSPEVFTINDFHILENTPMLFARKFDHEKEPELADRIDKILLGLQ